MADRRKIWLRIMLWVLAAAWMGLIFGFSRENDFQSDQTSDGVIRWALEHFDGEFSAMSPADQARRIDAWSFPVRKLAHLGIFAGLGFLCFAAFLADLPSRRAFLAALILGTVRGVLDELQQAFTPGRSCELMDMCIDAAGTLLGAAFLLLILRLTQRKKA